MCLSILSTVFSQPPVVILPDILPDIYLIFTWRYRTYLLRYGSSSSLNLSIFGADTALSGSLFHFGITLLAKNCFLISVRFCLTYSFCEFLLELVSLMIGMVRRCFTNRSANVIIPIYTSLIRPILETNSSAWNPWLKKDIDALERVQRRCEKLCIESLTFESLHERRYRADMRETFKLLKNAYKVNPDMFFKWKQDNLRGHPMRIHKQRSRTEIRRQFFSNRVVDAWNDFDENIVNAKKIPTFKTRLELNG